MPTVNHAHVHRAFPIHFLRTMRHFFDEDEDEDPYRNFFGDVEDEDDEFGGNESDPIEIDDDDFDESDYFCGGLRVEQRYELK